MSQNSQIVGMPLEAIRVALGLDHPRTFRAVTMEQLSDAGAEERGTGRTTKMLVEVLHQLSRGRKVAFLVNTQVEGRHFCNIIDSWCEQVFTKTGKRIHNLSRPILSRDGADQNEAIYTDHSYDPTPS